MKGQNFVKVTSILMIIGGVIAGIAGIVAILGVSALAALIGSADGAGLLYASTILAVVASVIELIAGIKGLKACKEPTKAGSCIIWGGLVAAICVISMVIGMIAGNSFDIISLVLNLILPGLYIFGLVQLKNGVSV